MKIFEELLIERAAKIKPREPLQNEGSVAWESPSNIAIVKYWGKYPGQIPANSSLSISLSKSLTKTKIDFTCKTEKNGPKVNFKFEGKEQPDFAARIVRYFQNIVVFMPWINSCEFTINSENTFPHSSGIASSASSMSAIALGLCEIEDMLFNEPDTDLFLKKASLLARYGSGSASRSVYGKMAVWGMTASCKKSTDEYAIPVEELHPAFNNMHDSILIIESGKKSISSSMGHDLMKTNPYSRLRFEAAEENMGRLCHIIRDGEIDQFIEVMENEALSLHAMMMTSKPGFLLMKPNTLNAIQKIRGYRNRTGKPVGFTMDAGANVHIIYPDTDAPEIIDFIDSELKPLCENGMVIHDMMGNGPSRVEP